MRRLEWQWTTAGATSELGDVSLKVEKDVDSYPPYSWEVRGVAETRSSAFEAAERAALAGARPVLDAQVVDGLLASVHRQQAYVVVEGRPDNSVLLPVLMAARAHVLAEQLKAKGEPKGRAKPVRAPRSKAAKKPGPKVKKAGAR